MIGIISRVFQVESLTFDRKSNYNAAQKTAIVINEGEKPSHPLLLGFDLFI